MSIKYKTIEDCIAAGIVEGAKGKVKDGDRFEAITIQYITTYKGYDGSPSCQRFMHKHDVKAFPVIHWNSFCATPADEFISDMEIQLNSTVANKPVVGFNPLPYKIFNGESPESVNLNEGSVVLWFSVGTDTWRDLYYRCLNKGDRWMYQPDMPKEYNPITSRYE